MQIAIISDIHDNVWRLKPLLRWLQEREEVKSLICCGDLCSPFVMGMMARQFDRRIHLVFGNNDADTFRIMNIAHQYSHIKVHGELAELVWQHGYLHMKEELADPFEQCEGTRIAVNHFDHIAAGLITSGRYDIVCFGHNHQLQVDYFDPESGKKQAKSSQSSRLFLNPGPVMGYNPGKQSEVASTFLLLDMDSREVEIHEVLASGKVT